MNVIEIRETDYKGRARREASALLEEVAVAGRVNVLRRDEVLDLMALAWLRGADAGAGEIEALIDRHLARFTDDPTTRPWGGNHDTAA